MYNVHWQLRWSAKWVSWKAKLRRSGLNLSYKSPDAAGFKGILENKMKGSTVLAFVGLVTAVVICTDVDHEVGEYAMNI